MTHPLISNKTDSKRSKLKPVDSFVIALVKEKKKQVALIADVTCMTATKQDMQHKDRACTRGCFQTELPHD